MHYDAGATDEAAWQSYMFQGYGWGNDKMFQCAGQTLDQMYAPSEFNTLSDTLERVSYVMNVMRPGSTTWSQNVNGGTLITTPGSISRGWTGVSASATGDSWQFPLLIDSVTKPLSETIFILDHRGDYATSMSGQGQAFTQGAYRFGESDYSTMRTTTSGTPRMKVGASPALPHPRSFNVLFGDSHAADTDQTNPDNWVVRSN
jgi:prepilin-type processing-associated H-X9-DG protein